MLKYLKALFSFLLLLALARPALAGSLSDATAFAAGVNGAWFDGPVAAFPADIEAGANAALSLSPHLSGVAAGYYGFDHSYWRGSFGARATVTDVANKNFTVGLGIQYHVASETSLPPNEWAPEATFGWFPFDTFKDVAVVGLASYGLKSAEARSLLGVRYALHLEGR